MSIKEMNNAYNNMREVGICIAANYAACWCNAGYDFGNFGSDSITHCYTYIDLVDRILKEHPEFENSIIDNKSIDTERFRYLICSAIEKNFPNKKQG